MRYGLHQAKKRASKHNYCIEYGARGSRKGKGVHIVTCDTGILVYGMKKYLFGRNSLHGRSLAFVTFMGGLFSTGSPNMCLTGFVLYSS